MVLSNLCYKDLLFQSKLVDHPSTRTSLQVTKRLLIVTVRAAFRAVLPHMLPSGGCLCDLQLTASLWLLCEITYTINTERATHIRRLALPFLHDVLKRVPSHNLHSELALTAFEALFPFPAPPAELRAEYCDQLLHFARLAGHDIPRETWYNLTGYISQAAIHGIDASNDLPRPLLRFFVGLLHGGARQRRFAIMVLYQVCGAPDFNRVTRNVWVPGAFVHRTATEPAVVSLMASPRMQQSALHALCQSIDNVAHALATFYAEEPRDIARLGIELSRLIQADPLCVGLSSDAGHEDSWPELLLQASLALSNGRPDDRDEASVASDVLLIQYHLLRQDMDEAFALAEISKKRHPDVFWFSYAYSEAARAALNINNAGSSLAQIHARVVAEPALRDSPTFMMWQRNVLESYLHCAFKLAQTAETREEWDGISMCLEDVGRIAETFTPQFSIDGRDVVAIIASHLLGQLVSKGARGFHGLEVRVRHNLLDSY